MVIESRTVAARGWGGKGDREFVSEGYFFTFYILQVYVLQGEDGAGGEWCCTTK